MCIYIINIYNSIPGKQYHETGPGWTPPTTDAFEPRPDRRKRRPGSRPSSRRLGIASGKFRASSGGPKNSRMPSRSTEATTRRRTSVKIYGFLIWHYLLVIKWYFYMRYERLWHWHTRRIGTVGIITNYYIIILRACTSIYTNDDSVMSRLLQRRNAQPDRIISVWKKIIIKG